MSLVHRFFFLTTVALTIAGSVVGQNSNPQVEQSRLFERTTSPVPNVTAEGVPIAEEEGAVAADESFGKQQILKAEEKIPEFVLSADASLFYTSNVALTSEDTVDDGFFVGGVTLSWTPRISNELQLVMGARASIFRYFDTSDLDFQTVGAGIGSIWTLPGMFGIALMPRYDFTELWDRHSDELLQDHQFSLTAQKIFVLGRSHALSFSLIGSLGIADPFAEQRDQIAFAIGYHLQVTRNFVADFGYRSSGYFYNEGRSDANHIFSMALRYYLTRWAVLEGFLSGAINTSNHSAFDYNVFTSGGGLGLTVRF